MTHTLLVIGRLLLKFDAAEHPRRLRSDQRRDVFLGFDTLDLRAGGIRPTERQEHAGMLEPRPDVIRIDAFGRLGDRERIQPAALLAEQHQQQPLCPGVLGVDLDRALQVGHGVAGTLVDLAVGTQHEGLGIEWFEQHGHGGLRAGLHADHHAPLGKDLADRHALLVEDRDGSEVGDLQLLRQLLHGHRLDQFDPDRIDDVVVEHHLDTLERLDLPEETAGAVLTSERLATAPGRFDFVTGRFARIDPAKTRRIDGQRGRFGR